MRRTKPSAQEMQDEIFRRMPAEKKLKLSAQLFNLARQLNPDYFKHGTESASGKGSKTARKP